MRCDILVAHAKGIGEKVGDFYGTPVHEMDTFAMSVQEDVEAHTRAKTSLGEPSAVELLPSEVITGNLTRRDTTSEAIGETFYEMEVPAGRQVSIEEALELSVVEGVLITWRPNNQNFAVIHEEVPSELPV
jgi:hypothetical protein